MGDLLVSQNITKVNSLRKCQVKLLNSKLWKKFYALGTEMVLTKLGRNMFPYLRLKFSNLERKEKYCVYLEFVLSSMNRFKFSEKLWKISGDANQQHSKRIYLHPRSPAYGENWMDFQVVFDKVKLTNDINTETMEHYIILNSMHLYQIKIHLIKLDDFLKGNRSSKVFVFPETQFMAVTTYQNPLIQLLKIDTNPHSRAHSLKYKRETFAHCDTSSETSSNQSQNSLIYTPFEADTKNNLIKIEMENDYFEKHAWYNHSLENEKDYFKNNQHLVKRKKNPYAIDHSLKYKRKINARYVTSSEISSNESENLLICKPFKIDTKNNLIKIEMENDYFEKHAWYKHSLEKEQNYFKNNQLQVKQKDDKFGIDLSNHSKTDTFVCEPPIKFELTETEVKSNFVNFSEFRFDGNNKENLCKNILNFDFYQNHYQYSLEGFQSFYNRHDYIFNWHLENYAKKSKLCKKPKTDFSIRAILGWD